MRLALRQAAHFWPRRAAFFFGALPICLLALSAPLHAQDAVVTLDPAQTHIGFTLGATLHTVHGNFRLKSGEIHFNLNTGNVSGSVVVDAASGESGNESRDKKMDQVYLESQKFPEIVFIPLRVKGSLSPGGTSQVEVAGTFRFHGEDHDLTLSMTIHSSGGRLQAATKFTVPYVKWGLKNPSTFVLRVSDKVDIEVHTIGRLAPAALGN